MKISDNRLPAPGPRATSNLHNRPAPAEMVHKPDSPRKGQSQGILQRRHEVLSLRSLFTWGERAKTWPQNARLQHQQRGSKCTLAGQTAETHNPFSKPFCYFNVQQIMLSVFFLKEEKHLDLRGSFCSSEGNCTNSESFHFLKFCLHALGWARSRRRFSAPTENQAWHDHTAARCQGDRSPKSTKVKQGDIWGC